MNDRKEWEFGSQELIFRGYCKLEKEISKRQKKVSATRCRGKNLHKFRESLQMSCRVFGAYQDTQ